jgi:hypothetical protein
MTSKLEEQIREIVIDTPFAISKDDVDEATRKLLSLFSKTLSSLQKEIEGMKVVEPPDDVERLRDKRQAFMAGQMNILLRLMERLADKLDTLAIKAEAQRNNLSEEEAIKLVDEVRDELPMNNLAQKREEER